VSPPPSAVEASVGALSVASPSVAAPSSPLSADSPLSSSPEDPLELPLELELVVPLLEPELPLRPELLKPLLVPELLVEASSPAPPPFGVLLLPHAPAPAAATTAIAVIPSHSIRRIVRIVKPSMRAGGVTPAARGPYHASLGPRLSYRAASRAGAEGRAAEWSSKARF
jgi:hypothetical protein